MCRDTKSAIAFWSARSRRAVSAGLVCPRNGRNAATAKVLRRSAAGDSAIPSTARKPNICLCQTRRRISQKFPTNSATNKLSLLADIASTGFSGAESAKIRIGDTVAVFAQGPIGLCATAGAKLIGASFIIGVEGDPVRMEMSKRMGAHVVLDPKQCDVVAEIKKLTGGGTDVAIEALGLQETFENALRCLRPGGTLSSLGVYSGKLQVPYDAFAAGLGDYKIVTTLCPGGKERMRRLMSMVQSKRFDPLPLLTHRFKLDQIVEAYDVFGSRREGCLKVAIKP